MFKYEEGRGGVRIIFFLIAIMLNSLLELTQYQIIIAMMLLKEGTCVYA